MPFDADAAASNLQKPSTSSGGFDAAGAAQALATPISSSGGFDAAAAQRALATPSSQVQPKSTSTPQQYRNQSQNPVERFLTTPPAILGTQADIDPKNPVGSLVSMWDKAYHRAADAVGNVVSPAANAAVNAATYHPPPGARVDPTVQMLHGTPQQQVSRQHAVGTALEKIGDWLPTTVAASGLGAVASDLNPRTPSGGYAADWTRRMLRGDVVGATDEYFPTSGKELQRLDEAGVPVVSAAAHQMRNHPILTGIGTTAALWKAPNIEGKIVDALGAGGRAVAPAVKRAAQGAAERIMPTSDQLLGSLSPAQREAAEKLLKGEVDVVADPKVTSVVRRIQNPPAVSKAAASAVRVGKSAHEEFQKRFGSPARHLANAVPDTPEARAAAQNQGMRHIAAPRTAMADAASRTQYAFRPKHRTSIGMMPQEVGEGSSSAEREQAVDYYQAREHALAFSRAPEPIQAAATSMNKSWEKYKADPKNAREIIDANPDGVPRDADQKPIWDAMDVSFAPDHFIEREANARGISHADHGQVYSAARNQYFASIVKPDALDLSSLDPKAGVRVARMAHGIRHVINETTERLKRTDPSLLPSEKTGYFPQRNVLEDLPDPAEEGVESPNRRGQAVRTPYKQHSKYGTIAQMRKAFPGRKIWGGLSPEDALRDDLQRKWTNIHATNAFNTLGGMTDRLGNRIHDQEIYTDPKTGEQINHTEAMKRAREDVINDSLYAAAANRGDRLNPRTGLPEHFASRIPNVDAAKERALLAHKDMKRDQKLQDRLGQQGTRSVDAAVNSALRQEESTQRLAGKMDTNAEAIKGAQYLQTEETRKALEQEKQRAMTAKKAAKERLTGIPPASETQAEHDTSFDEAKKTQDYLGRAFYSAQAAAKRKIGRATEKGRKTISGRSVRMTNLAQKFQQRQKVLHAYSIDAQQAERKRLESIARKYATSSNDRFRKAVTRYYVGAYDQKRRDQFLQLAKNIRAEMNLDAPAVAERVQKQFRSQDPHYINGSDLIKAGINIPGVGPDTRMAKDAYDFFIANKVPAQEASDFSRVMGSLDNFARMGIVFDPIIHGVFNLGSTYVGRTRDFAGLAKAMPMLLGTMAGHEGAFKRWEAANAREIELLKIENGWQPGGFSEQLPYFLPREEERDPTGRIVGYKPAADASENYSAMRRSVSRPEALPMPQRVMKLMDEFAEWNSHVTFDRFEKWYAVNLFKHETKRLGSTALAARSVRDAMGTDLITPFERQIMNHPLGLFFYPWFKTIVRFAIATGIHDPAWWNAPLQGARVERENEGAGDIRVGNNPYMYVTKDPRGGFDTHAPPLPQRILNDIATIIEGPVDSRDPQAVGRLGAAWNMISSRAKPLSGWAANTAIEAASGGKSPAYEQTFDPAAGPGEMSKELIGNLIGRYGTPFQHETEQQSGSGLGNGIGDILGIRSGYRLPGDDVGGSAPGSPAARFYGKRADYEAQLKKYAPGARHESAWAYDRAKEELDALYRQYPMMKP